MKVHIVTDSTKDNQIKKVFPTVEFATSYIEKYSKYDLYYNVCPVLQSIEEKDDIEHTELEEKALWNNMAVTWKRVDESGKLEEREKRHRKNDLNEFKNKMSTNLAKIFYRTILEEDEYDKYKHPMKGLISELDKVFGPFEEEKPNIKSNDSKVNETLNPNVLPSLNASIIDGIMPEFKHHQIIPDSMDNIVNRIIDNLFSKLDRWAVKQYLQEVEKDK